MPMDEAGFWSVIALFDWRKTGDDDAVVEPAVAALAARSVADICKFEEIMTEKLFAIDGEAWARRIGECAYDGDESYFSVDEFLYARCAEVASGIAHYSKVLANPKKIQKDTEFESLLYVAQTAHRRKGKEELPITTDRSYETFANGQQWKR